MVNNQVDYRKHWEHGFIAHPRGYLYEALSSGIIDVDEFFVLCILWANATPYGYVQNINATIVVEMSCGYFEKRGFADSKNAANKVLLSLKEKQFIDYPNMQGQSGTCKVKLDKFLTKKGFIIDLLNQKTTDSAEGKAQKSVERSTTDNDKFSDIAEVGEKPQRLDNVISEFAQLFSVNPERTARRSSYNDTYKENEKNNDESLAIKSFSYNEEIPIEGFYPKTHEQEQCWEIARDIGEKSMNYILAKLAKHGYHIIEQAYNIYKNDLSRGKQIHKPAAYFNGIIETLIIQSDE